MFVLTKCLYIVFGLKLLENYLTFSQHSNVILYFMSEMTCCILTSMLTILMTLK